MSDWQVGDLALCVDDSPCQCGNCGGTMTTLELGKVYRVTAVLPRQQRGNPNHKWVGLSLSPVPPPAPGHASDGYVTTRFVKVKPDEPKACEEEFRILLQLSKKRCVA